MMMRRLAVLRAPLPIVLLVAIVTVAALALYSYWVVLEWRRSATALADRAAYDSAVLLVTALTRDMHGAQSRVLASRDAGDFSTGTLADSTNRVATAFTRFPYPESFFAWRKGDNSLVFFDRVNREPSWAEARDAPPQSVVVLRDAPFGDLLLEQLKSDALTRRSYSYVQTSIGEDDYQIVARFEYSNAYRDELEQITGFTVNLSWVRDEYFSEMVAQVARISRTHVVLDYSILDEHKKVIAGAVVREPATTFELPLQFFDPWTSDGPLLLEPPPAMWTVRVSAANDPTVVSATRSAQWTLLAISTTAIMLVCGIFLMAHAVQQNAAVAAMRADFVATVTHNLKAPLATIRAVGDTMIRQRVDAVTARKYAVRLVDESRRLSRLVDNTLAYAKINDVTEAYSFEQLSVAELIEDSAAGFHQSLSDGHFELAIDVPHDLPAVRGDRTALRLALDNLLDNAMRYSADARWIAIVARRVQGFVVVEINDRGVGIPENELDAVQRKFVRGSRTRNSGTGLGLTIARRIVFDHGGQFDLRSEVDRGTSAILRLPIFE